ncbi:hypothetical protein HPB50_028274 [Hyalomma asiaticum]|nr:hypothetical protein HPB50_028274 [Hyalomma asiaticum]
MTRSVPLQAGERADTETRSARIRMRDEHTFRVQKHGAAAATKSPSREPHADLALAHLPPLPVADKARVNFGSDGRRAEWAEGAGLAIWLPLSVFRDRDENSSWRTELSSRIRDTSVRSEEQCLRSSESDAERGTVARGGRCLNVGGEGLERSDGRDFAGPACLVWHAASSTSWAFSVVAYGRRGCVGRATIGGASRLAGATGFADDPTSYLACAT